MYQVLYQIRVWLQEGRGIRSMHNPFQFRGQSQVYTDREGAYKGITKLLSYAPCETECTTKILQEELSSVELIWIFPTDEREYFGGTDEELGGTGAAFTEQMRLRMLRLGFE